MYVTRVVLKNIRGFKEANLDFSPEDGNAAGWAVVTGDNGSGKSTLLRAIALATLGPDQSRGLAPDLSGWVTDGLDEGSISVEIIPDHDVDKTKRGGWPTNSLWAEVSIRREGSTWNAHPADIFRNKKKGAVNGPWEAGTAGWFTVAYGPFRRMYGSSPDAQRLMVIPGRIPHFATLFKEDATLAEGEEWIRQLNYRRLEKKEEDTIALDNLLRLVGEDFLREGMRISEVNSEGIWLMDQAGRRISMSDMSEGYRASLAMLIDIYRLMVETYGARDLIDASEEGVIVNRPGVVLIDEIDAHLHPQWQRKIGFWLKEHFPKIQFIVTTHSPIVCQAADKGRIYHMPDMRDGLAPFQLSQTDFRSIIAGKPNEILLSPAFGMEQTRSPRAVYARRQHARLKSRQMTLGGLSDDEIREMQQLSLFVGSDDASDK